MNNQKLIGIVGAGLLFCGIFAPIISIPIVGNVNYIGNGRGEGVYILPLAVATLVLVLLEKYKWLWVTGISSLGIMMYTFVKLQAALHETAPDTTKALEGNPFKEIAENLASAAAQTVQIQWGWAVLFAGVGCILASAGMSPLFDGKFSFKFPDLGYFRRIVWLIKTNRYSRYFLLCVIVVLGLAAGAYTIYYFKGPCPWGTDLVGQAPPNGFEQWCQKQGESGTFVRHGPYQSWYDNGTLKERGEFNNGKMTGHWISWHETGNKRMEGTREESEQKGLWTFYYENGQIEKEGNIIREKFDGIWTYWHKNGAKKQEISYQAGVLTGHWIAWDEQGIVTKEATEFQLASKQCDQLEASGCSVLCDMYFDGKGVPQDRKMAFSYCEKSCANGNDWRCFKLGLIYSEGQGVELDMQRAIEMFGKACKAGHGEACNRLAIEYENGNNIQKDSKLAFWLYREACTKNVGQACGRYGLAYYFNEPGIPLNDINRNNRLQIAFSFFSEGCEKGDDNSCINMGICYHNGEGVKRDTKTASEILGKFCGNGNKRACEGIVNMNNK
ncbi:MAG: hypothetical protein C4523_11630 [Myxococcales bacterium]|nr:MAG: hypothetical protein C4523_11630 [Myxococcales bacterium]